MPQGKGKKGFNILPLSLEGKCHFFNEYCVPHPKYNLNRKERKLTGVHRKVQEEINDVEAGEAEQYHIQQLITLPIKKKVPWFSKLLLSFPAQPVRLSNTHTHYNTR